MNRQSMADTIRDSDQEREILLTKEGYEQLKVELEQLLDKRIEIAGDIRESLEHGEFSEDNPELDEVKQSQAFVESRIEQLKAVFTHARAIDPSEIPTSEAGIGSYVTVKDLEYGDQFVVRLVSSIEADPDRDFLSDQSPMGHCLLGAKKGEDIVFEAPEGEKRFHVVKISAKP
ncbi:MAG: GreA/GreB family elongation factor [Fimbriimonadaceae bacterium]